MSPSLKSRLVLPVLVLAVVVLPGCTATSATQVLVFESSPMIQRYEEMRTQLAEQEKTAGGSIQKGGCPVCTW